MLKKMMNSFKKKSSANDESPEIKVGNIQGVITQVHKEPATSPTPTSELGEEDDEDKDSCISRCCSCLFGKSNREPKTVEEFIYLGPQSHQNLGRKTLVLDLDETLVHSSFEGNSNPDILLPVKVQDDIFKIRVMVRPGAEEYLRKMGEIYEVVVFTASLAEYADPLVDILDKTGVVAYRLFREHCTLFNGVYVKDLSRLGRDLKDVIIVDNSPNSFMFQPKNALLIKNFFEDKTDNELETLTPFFQFMAGVFDVRPVEAWRAKYYKGEAEDFLVAQKSPHLGDYTEEVSGDDVSPLHTEKKRSNDYRSDIIGINNEEGNKELEGIQMMVNPRTMGDSVTTRQNYHNIKAKKDKRLNKSSIHLKGGSLFPQKSETDEKSFSNTNRSHLHLDNKMFAATERVCVTEYLADDISPYELEKVKQLEISNDIEVEDLTRHEERRASNSKAFNIQSPIHKSTKIFTYPSEQQGK